MKKLLVVAVALILVAPGVAFSGEIETSATKIVDVTSGYDYGTTTFTTTSQINPASCSNTAYLLHPNLADTEKGLAMVLLAQTTQKDVKVTLRTDLCYANYPVVTKVTILGN